MTVISSWNVTPHSLVDVYRITNALLSERRSGRIIGNRPVGKRALSEPVGVWGTMMDSEALIRAAFATLERWKTCLFRVTNEWYGKVREDGIKDSGPAQEHSR
jgi:hypothetical protein